MTSQKTRPIGVFDSGVGGLTVVKSLRKYLPDEDIIYFGDTARVPYGNKSPSTIKRFSREIIWFLLEKNVKMVVVACNTASSLALPFLEKDYSIPVIGVIKPGVEEAARASRNKRIGVIGTSSTISSRAYEKTLKKIAKSSKLFAQSCPLFVPLVENRFLSGKIAKEIADWYLKALKKKNIDTLILGCTHYPLLANVIKGVMGKTVLVDSAHAVARTAKRILIARGIRFNGRRSRASIKYYVSDDPESFKKTAGIFLKEKIDARKVTL